MFQKRRLANPHTQSKRDKASRQSQDPLPIIAPKQKQPSKPNSSSSLSYSGARTSKTMRVPPRSRYGCWTCRLRKVKCDEGRPKCTPCTRLGHQCDYSPRLSFKDDTPRVLEKMRPYTDSSSWALPTRKYDCYESVKDLLPPFSELTCDEDRERKAEHQEPGTYHIIINPASFGSPEQYADNRDCTDSGPGWRSQCTDRRSPVSTPNLGQDVFEDPNTLILGNFDENVRSSRSPSLTSHSSLMNYTQPAQPPKQSNGVMSSPETAMDAGEDLHIIFFYKSFVRRQINQVHRDSLGTSEHCSTPTIPEVLDEQAPKYNTPVSSLGSPCIRANIDCSWISRFVAQRTARQLLHTSSRRRYKLFPNSHNLESLIVRRATCSTFAVSSFFMRQPY